MNTPLVSIIVPVYKVEKYIGQCVESIQNQTYKNLQVILVNDGSPDRSGELCEQYKKKDLRIEVYHKGNEGVSVARNYGLKHAKGDWVFFIDSDDWIAPNTIEICINEITKGDYDICFIGNTPVYEGKSIQYGEEESILGELSEKEFREFQLHILNRDRKICCDRSIIKLASPCKMYSRSFLQRYGIYFPLNLKNGEDAVFNLYAYRSAKKGVYIQKKLYYYRQHSESVTHRFDSNVEKNFDLLHKMQKEFIESDKNKNELMQAFHERIMWSLGFECILKYCHKDNPAHFKQRKREFLSEVQRYKTEITKVNLHNFGIKKAILFWNIRKKNFTIVTLLCLLEELSQKIKG